MKFNIATKLFYCWLSGALTKANKEFGNQHRKDNDSCIKKYEMYRLGFVSMIRERRYAVVAVA